MNNAAGTGAGTINDTGMYSTLYFDNTQTFNNATINLGNASGGFQPSFQDDTTGAGTVLTLGSQVTIDESGLGYIADGGYASDGLVDQGNISQTELAAVGKNPRQFLHQQRTITAASSGGALTIEPTTFTNSGTCCLQW